MILLSLLWATRRFIPVAANWIVRWPLKRRSCLPECGSALADRAESRTGTASAQLSLENEFVMTTTTSSKGSLSAGVPVTRNENLALNWPCK